MDVLLFLKKVNGHILAKLKTSTDLHMVLVGVLLNKVLVN